MVKRYIKQAAILMAVSLGLSGTGFALTVLAQENTGYVTDQAGLFSESEVSELEAQAAELAEETSWDVMAVTTEDAQGMEAVAYGEQWLDQHMTGEDGIICLIDMDNREMVVSGTGEAQYYLSDDRKDKMLDDAYPKISNEEYAAAMKTMLKGMEQAYQNGVPKGSYLYDEDTGEVMKYEDVKKLTPVEILAAAAAALAAGGITAGAVIGKYRLKFGGYKYPIEKNGSVKLNKKEDVFINQFVTQRHIPKEETEGGGGGQSTVHTGAGDRSYSSDSKKF